MAPIFESNFSIRSLIDTNSSDEEMMDVQRDHVNNPSQQLNGNITLPPTPPADEENPGYTYSTLIIMAIRSSREQRMLLCNIYDWIAERFPSFVKQRPNWQNQVRHTLSTNSCFAKVPRALDDPGRGNYWAMNTTYPGMDTNSMMGQLQHPNGFTNQHPYSQSLAHGVSFQHPLATSAVYFPSPEEIQLHMQKEQEIYNNFHLQQQFYHQQVMQMQQ